MSEIVSRTEREIIDIALDIHISGKVYETIKSSVASAYDYVIVSFGSHKTAAIFLFVCHIAEDDFIVNQFLY